MNKQYYLCGIKISKWELIILYIIVFCVSFWYAPNDWSKWWETPDNLKQKGKYVAIEQSIDMGKYILVVTDEGHCGQNNK